MIIADDRTKKNIEMVLEVFDNLCLENVIIILSPVTVEKAGTELFLDVFPLWLEYYRDKNLFKLHCLLYLLYLDRGYYNPILENLQLF